MKTHRIIALSAAAVISAAALSSCSGSDEPNEIAYVVGLGVDKGEGDDYSVTIQFAKPNQISGGASGEGGKGGDVTDTLTIGAPNIYSAVDAANQIISKKFSLAHTKLIVFSEEIAREGIGGIIESLVRSEEVRPDAYLAVSLTDAKDYLNNVKPLMEVNPAMYYRLVFEDSENSGMVKSVMQDFYLVNEGGITDVALPLTNVASGSDSGESSGAEASGGSGEGSDGMGMTEPSGGGESSGGSDTEASDAGGSREKSASKKQSAPVNEGAFEYRIRDYRAGEIAESKTNKGETAGMAIFSGDKMIAEAGLIECKLLNLIKGEFRRGYLTYQGDEDEAPVTVRIEQKRRPSVKVKLSGGTPRVKYTLWLEGSAGSLSGRYIGAENLSRLRERIIADTEEALDNFLNKTARDYRADIAGTGNFIKSRFLDYNSFGRYDWQKKLEECEYETEVRFEFE